MKPKNYLESAESKKWMDKNLLPREQSQFIRDAVAEKIAKIKKSKAR